MMSINNEPGGRIEGENPEQYRTFTIYRSEKSISKTLDKMKESGMKVKTRRTLERWCVKFNWVERLHEWDDFLDLKTREEIVKKKRNQIEEEAKIYATQLGVAMSALKKKINVNDKMSYSEILKYIKFGIEGRRRLCEDFNRMDQMHPSENSQSSDLAMLNAIRNMNDEELEYHIKRYNRIMSSMDGETKNENPS